MAFMVLCVWAASHLLEKMPDKPKAKKLVLALTLALIAGFLVLLKDFRFFTRLFGISDEAAHISAFAAFAPVGVSYWSLSLVAYLVDCYRGIQKPEPNIAKFFTFAAFFPLLVSGPIVRFGETGGQMLEGHKFDYDSLCFGVQRVLWGLFKKLVVAERCAVIVNTVYSSADSFCGFYIWVATALFFLQLFCDFSGCIDIVLGVAQCFGIKLPENFDMPFGAKTIAEFWRRWHITLGAWLRDYIYIPLGGNRKGIVRKYANIFVVFLVSGFWHGGSFNYLAWGALHGIYQIIGGLTFGARKKLCRLLAIDREKFSFKLYQCCCVFFLNLVAWIFFRASSLRNGLRILRLSAKLNPWIFFDGSLYKLGLDVTEIHILFAALVILVCAACVKLKTQKSVRAVIAEQNIAFRWALWILFAFFVITFGKYGAGEESLSFIYFKF